MKASDIYNEWFGRELQGLWYENGYFDSSPMNNTIYTKLFPNEEFGRMASVGTVNLKSGKFTVFNTTLPIEKLSIGIRASMTGAGMFPPVVYGDSMYITGTSVFPADLRCIKQYCNSLGYEDSSIKAIVVTSSSR
jgi:predicted acylesterase/phospholipase RssA